MNRLLHQIVYSTLSTRIRHFFAPFARKIFLSVKKSTFIFRGKEYKYFDHLHNVTWKNERAVEIPIALELLKKFKGKRILEIGDTLHHYANINHDVVDKYEMNEPKVIRMDVIDYKPKKKYLNRSINFSVYFQKMARSLSLFHMDIIQI